MVNSNGLLMEFFYPKKTNISEIEECTNAVKLKTKKMSELYNAI